MHPTLRPTDGQRASQRQKARIDAEVQARGRIERQIAQLESEAITHFTEGRDHLAAEAALEIAQLAGRLGHARRLTLPSAHFLRLLQRSRN
jgi:hypothetical protein